MMEEKQEEPFDKLNNWENVEKNTKIVQKKKSKKKLYIKIIPSGLCAHTWCGIKYD